ncbi:MAG TPA: hypothetical protein VMV93_01780 [Chloroflexota bacterium]|nr:hypothetical protein [Chloroflexota bacterium]
MDSKQAIASPEFAKPRAGAEDERGVMGRRAFLRFAGLASAVGVPALLAACGGGTTAASTGAAPAGSSAAAPASSPATSAAPAVSAAASSTGASAAANPGGKLALPTYIPSTLVKPDLAGGENGLIDPGFLNYPKNPPRSVTATPAKGGQVTVTTWTNANGGAVVPVDQNPAWQAINKELGTNVKINAVPLNDYFVKLPTIVAGGDLPDLLYIPSASALAELPKFLNSAMTDLTPYLSGDAIKDYPNLANFPPNAWRNVVFNNAIYGVVVPYPPFLWIHWAHQELLDQDHLSMPTSAADYTNLLKHFTNPQQNLWGVGIENSPGTGFSLDVGFFSSFFGAPNQWGYENGKLVRMIETDQFKQAMSYANELWKAGYITPNAVSNGITQQRSDMAARHTVFDWDGFQQASQLFWQTQDNLKPPGKYRIVPPFAADGKSKPAYWANNGSFGFVGIKKTTPDRVKQLLGVLNYIAAPFGTQEYLLIHYGVEGVDYKMDAGNNPILTSKGKIDTGLPWVYIAQPPGFLYYAGATDYPKVLQDGEKAMFPALVEDPTVGHYSATFSSKDRPLMQAVSDGITAIVRGQQPMSSWTGILDKWRTGGGDQMRAEFQEAIGASK